MDEIDYDVLDFNEWIEFGVKQGWISEPTCYYHDSLPMTDIEYEEVDEGGDPCINVVRIWFQT